MLPRIQHLRANRPLSKGSHMRFRRFSTSTIHQDRSMETIIPNTSIRIFREIPALRRWRRKQLLDYRSVGLVPTMGALHAGHSSLIRMAAKENSSVVVSIYVNPTQFGIHEDFNSYPQTWDQDCKKLRDLDRELAADGGNLGRIAAVFAPTSTSMYPSGPPGQEVDAKGSFVTITPVGEILEGARRPTFFRGVATVCMKLFNIVQPDKVYFGQKDVQQTVVIKKMVKDFCMDTQVVIGETQREPGLALSSRNMYLGTRRRQVATILSRMLELAAKKYAEGRRARAEILGPSQLLAASLLQEQMAKKPEERVRFEIDYISLADPESMEELEVINEQRGAILSGALKLQPVEAPQEGEDLGFAGGPAVRLIDNVVIKGQESE